MAKQNFLSGGYYGKLGQTVGQRWKNIRTIRTYVIPHNPRTPAQQANRSTFGTSVFYAQVAMQLNYKAPCFESATQTAWNMRMSVARNLQSLGLEELELFPLYPINFSVPYKITAANVSEVIDETHISVAVTGTLPEKERVLTMLLLLPGSEDWKERLAVCVGQNSSEDYNTFTFTIPGGVELSSGMECRFISCDDTDSATDLISSAQIPLAYSPIVPTVFDTTVTNISRSSNTFTLTMAEPYVEGNVSVSNVSLHCVKLGAWVDINNLSVSVINNNGYFALVFVCPETESENIWALPSGSSISIGSITVRTSSSVATASDVTESLESADLTRTVSAQPTVDTSTGQVRFTWAFDANISSATSSVSCTVKHNEGMLFKEETLANTSVGSDGATLYIQPNYEEDLPLLLVGSFIAPASTISAVINGVTYKIPASTFYVDSSSYTAKVANGDYFSYATGAMYMEWPISGASGAPVITGISMRNSPKYAYTEGESGDAYTITISSVAGFVVNTSRCYVEFGASIPAAAMSETEMYMSDNCELPIAITQSGTTFPAVVVFPDGETVTNEE